MSISTKGGDRGQTSLYSGERVSKANLRVEAYGTLDELDSYLGFAKHQVGVIRVYELLVQVQRQLHRAMGELANLSSSFKEAITPEEVEEITEQIHQYEALVELKGFVIPGGCAASAPLDICRSVVRRAERRIVELAETQSVSATLLMYINRLSDLFFILARYLEAQRGMIVYVKSY